MIETLTQESHNILLFSSTFLMGLLLGATVSTTVFVLQEIKKKKIDRFHNND
jgi:hypothetical protein